MDQHPDIPAVLFLVFNRPEQTRLVFEAIARAKPRQLYIAADGPRDDVENDARACREVREIVSQVDWDCEVKTLMRQKNLGCRDSVSQAIDWFFEQVEEGIILEDDCLPSSSFFRYCSELLELYRAEERVMMISGNSYRPEVAGDNASYYFSKIARVWGWATWKSAWRHYDVNMSDLPEFLKNDGLHSLSKDPDIQAHWARLLIDTHEGRIETWDYQWFYAILKRNALVARPAINLMENIGMGEGATHTTQFNERMALTRGEIGALRHPETIAVDELADWHEHKEVECATCCHIKNPIMRWRKRLRRRWKAMRKIRDFVK